MTWLNSCKLFMCFYCADTKDSICLLSFFNLHELFPGFICASDIRSLVYNLLGVQVFNPFPSFTSSSSPSGGGISGISMNSSELP